MSTLPRYGKLGSGVDPYTHGQVGVPYALEPIKVSNKQTGVTVKTEHVAQTALEKLKTALIANLNKIRANENALRDDDVS